MTTLQVRISDEDKKAVQKILEDLGMDLPTAVRIFLKKVKETRGIPFRVVKRVRRAKVDENGLTDRQIRAILKAEKEAEMGINVSPRFDNIEDAIKYLNSDEN